MKLNYTDVTYLGMLEEVMRDGYDRADRTGVGTRSLFGALSRYDISTFPLLQSKKLWWRAIVEELLWFLSGSTNAKDLQAKGITIWDEWATAEQCARFGRKEGDLGPVYGHQWRNFGATLRKDGSYNQDGVDQIANVIEQIRTNPDSRRLIVSGWNPAEANQVALPPCHTLFQFYVLDGALSCHLYQRSGDIFLGIPYNIASYALLTMMIAHVTGLEPGDLVHTVGDLHLYSNHVAAAKEQLARPRVWESPVVTLNPDKKDIFAFTYEDIVLSNYNPHPAIKADVAV